MNTLDIIGITCGGVSIIYSDKERRSDNNVRLVFPEKEYLNLRIIESQYLFGLLVYSNKETHQIAYRA